MKKLNDLSTDYTDLHRFLFILVETVGEQVQPGLPATCLVGIP